MHAHRTKERQAGAKEPECLSVKATRGSRLRRSFTSGPALLALRVHTLSRGNYCLYPFDRSPCAQRRPAGGLSRKRQTRLRSFSAAAGRSIGAFLLSRSTEGGNLNSAARRGSGVYWFFGGEVGRFANGSRGWEIGISCGC